MPETRTRFIVVVAVLLLLGGITGVLQTLTPDSTEPPQIAPTSSEVPLEILAFFPIYPENTLIMVDGVTRDDVSFDLTIYTDGRIVFGQISGVFPQNTGGNICFTPEQDIPIAERGAEGITISREYLHCFQTGVLIPLNAE